MNINMIFLFFNVFLFTIKQIWLTGFHSLGRLPGPVNMACRKKYKVKIALLINITNTIVPLADNQGGHHWLKHDTVAIVTALMIAGKYQCKSFESNQKGI